MATDINTILSWFKTGLKPTQAQFWASWQSFWHKDEQIPQSSIADLSTTLNAKAEKSQFEGHITDLNAHADLLDLKENKANKGISNGYAPLDEIGKLVINYLNVVNDLVTGGTESLLTAEQGKILQTQIDAINTLLSSDDINLDTIQEIVDAIKKVEISLSTILVNDLTTGGITKALTAEMGKTLKGLVDSLTTNVSEKENADNKSNSVSDILSQTKFPTWKVLSDWALGLFKKKYLQFIDVPGTVYTFGVDADNSRFKFTNNNPISATIPTNAIQPYDVGTVFETISIGGGVLTVKGDVGVEIISNLYKPSAQNEVRRYTKIAINTWTVEGNHNNVTPGLQEVLNATPSDILIMGGNKDLSLGPSLKQCLYLGSGGVTIYTNGELGRVNYTARDIQVINDGNILILQYPYWVDGTKIKVLPISVHNSFANGAGNIELSSAFGSFLSADGKTITVNNGVIDSIV